MDGKGQIADHLLFAVMVIGLELLIHQALQNRRKKNLVIALKLDQNLKPQYVWILIQKYKPGTDRQTELKTTFLYAKPWKRGYHYHPEFTGTVTESLSSQHHKSVMIQKQLTKCRDGIKPSILALLKPMAYQNTYAVAVPKDCPRVCGLKTISDLKRWKDNSGQAFAEFNDREDGLQRLVEDLWSQLQVSFHHGQPPSLLAGDPVRGYSNNGCLLNRCRAGSLWPGSNPWRWHYQPPTTLSGRPHEKLFLKHPCSRSQCRAKITSQDEPRWTTQVGVEKAKPVIC